MTRRRSYTHASRVTTIDAETGEVLAVDQCYSPNEMHRIVATGNQIADPSLRAAQRRRYISNEKRQRR